MVQYTPQIVPQHKTSPVAVMEYQKANENMTNMIVFWFILVILYVCIALREDSKCEPIIVNFNSVHGYDNNDTVITIAIDGW